VTPLSHPAVAVTSPPPSFPAPSSSSTPSTSSRLSGEKRGKESSDEDGEEKKAEVAASQAMIEDYNLLKSKRQKLKERKARAKQRRETEADLRPLLPDEMEKKRAWLLTGLNAPPDEVDRASRGHPHAHPALLELLAEVSLEDMFPLIPHPLMIEIRRLFLSPPPFTQHAVYTVCDAFVATSHGRAP
jgi:hypothetical protein